jgi:hypothetical protein
MSMIYLYIIGGQMLFPTDHRLPYEVERHEYGYEPQHAGVYFLSETELNRVRVVFQHIAQDNIKHGIKHLIFEIRPARIGVAHDIFEFFEIKEFLTRKHKEL